MSERDPKLLIEDMVYAIKKIKRYTADIKSMEHFKANELVADAVMRNLEVLGSGDYLENYPLSTA